MQTRKRGQCLGGANDWGRKNWEMGCSSIIDTGFNGGGLCSFSCLNRYVEYFGISHPEENYLKRTENE